MKNKTITIENLAQIVQRGFEESETRTDKKIDNLAAMVQKGFLEINDQFSIIRDDIKKLDLKVDALRLEMETRLDNIEKRLGIIETKVFDEYHERISRLEEIVFKLGRNK